jgi:hypothetical protein
MSKIRYYYDDRNRPIWEIDITTNMEYKDTSFKATVREIISWGKDKNNKYLEPVDYNDYLDCSINWEAYSHFYFGELDAAGNRDSYLHICGTDSFKKHQEIIKILFDLAHKEMGRKPEESWGELSNVIKGNK